MYIQVEKVALVKGERSNLTFMQTKLCSNRMTHERLNNYKYIN